MLREGYPLYPLGSLQDTAIQYSLVKEQNIEKEKFRGLARAFALAVSAPYSRDTNQLNQDFIDILEDVTAYIGFDEKRITEKYKFRRHHKDNLVKMISRMPVNPIQFQKGIKPSDKE